MMQGWVEPAIVESQSTIARPDEVTRLRIFSCLFKEMVAI
jgi:hypothetical protein